MSTRGYPDRIVHDYGICGDCGKVRYACRKDARRIARSKGWHGMNAYQCGDYWHLGHPPTALRRGQISRGDLT